MATRTQATPRMAEFATKYRLRLVDTGAEKIVPGKLGQIADMNDDGLLRLRLVAAPRGANMDKALRSRREKALAGGLILKWRGQAESIFYFDPANEAQVRLAIKLVGARCKRVRKMDEAQRQVLIARLAVARAMKHQNVA
jgi:hypothetical protein